MPTAQDSWDVPSMTNPETSYEVTRDSQGSYRCSCKHWIYRRAQLPDGCKHIKSIIAMLSQAQEQAPAPERRRLKRSCTAQSPKSPSCSPPRLRIIRYGTGLKTGT